MDRAQSGRSFSSFRSQDSHERAAEPKLSNFTLGGLITTGGGSKRIDLDDFETCGLSLVSERSDILLMPSPGGALVKRSCPDGSLVVKAERRVAAGAVGSGCTSC